MDNALKHLQQYLISKFHFDESEVGPNVLLVNELGLDSLDLIETIMQMEADFNISIPDKDVQEITSVGQAAAYIDALREKMHNAV